MNSKIGSYNYFCEEVCRFREMMGLRKYMLDFVKMLDAWRGLLYVAMLTEEKPKEVDLILDATMIEFNMRTKYCFLKV